MDKPKIVVLSGSTRFREEFDKAAERFTLAGVIVLMPHVWVRSDPAYADISDEDKYNLDELHLHKIDMADELFVVNPEGYIGASTTKEIEYAIRTNTPVVYLVPRRPELAPVTSSIRYE